MAYNGETLGSTTHGLILLQMYLCVCHSFFMHATLHNIACSHFEHLVLEGFPHQSQGLLVDFGGVFSCFDTSLMLVDYSGTALPLTARPSVPFWRKGVHLFCVVFTISRAIPER